MHPLFGHINFRLDRTGITVYCSSPTEQSLYFSTHSKITGATMKLQFQHKLLAVLIAAATASSALAQSTQRPEEIVVLGRRVSTAANAIGQDSVSNSVGVTREALLSAPAALRLQAPLPPCSPYRSASTQSR
jgi:hypothetical protein